MEVAIIFFRFRHRYVKKDVTGRSVQVTGNYYYVPSLSELQELRGWSLTKPEERGEDSEESSPSTAPLEINFEYWYVVLQP